jgi:transposase
VKKKYREQPHPPEQPFLLPPSLDELVPQNAPVRMLREVVSRLDLGEVEEGYSHVGNRRYAPRMLLTVHLLGFMEGVRSSRRLEQALLTDVRFMLVSGMSHPDYRTIARFRRDNAEHIKGLFVQTVELCQEAGLVLMEHVSVDGTKIEADVALRETYSAERLAKARAALAERIERLLKEADEIDSLEDSELGDRRRDELPEELKDAARRKKRLDEAEAKLRETGHRSVPATDTDARVMKTRSGNRPSYNGQVTADSYRLVIVAADMTNDCTDNAQFEPMLEQATENTGAQPKEATADCGYHNKETLEYIARTGLNAFIPYGGRESKSAEEYTYEAEKDTYTSKDGVVLTFRRVRKSAGLTHRVYRSSRSKAHKSRELCVRADDDLQKKMKAKMATAEAKAIYKWRQQVVEPVFGRLKTRFNLRRFLLRGLAGARAEFLLACMAYNLDKIRVYGRQLEVAEAV